MGIRIKFNELLSAAQWKPDKINYHRFALSNDVIRNLKEMGHIIGEEFQSGRAQGILIDYDENILYGGTDSRGFGKASGY